MQEFRKGLILEPLLFNIFINCLFRFATNSNLSNYTDDGISYAGSFNLEEVKNLITGFDAHCCYENHIPLNVGKGDFMCFGKDTGNETFIFKGTARNKQRTKKNKTKLQEQKKKKKKKKKYSGLL